ncbi:probable terpene synthase 6 [Rutidosis leptorrhynchoides]|uniref:probable terpene synthase 6 n=1 Tax=Rutidosis leptorrhynchoides TaxID=125765 RepID=UPI003A991445
MALEINSVSPVNSDVVRRTANFPPPLWGDRFASFSVDRKVMGRYDEDIKTLKVTVKKLLMASTNEPLKNVGLIDVLCSLGVSYHFESEIAQQLASAFDSLTSLVDALGFDLYGVANLFRLFREHGHIMPCDVFEKFRDSDGKFKEALIGDAKGMLSLYEACQLAMNGEQILDDALTFTKSRLESLSTATDQSSPHLAKLIRSALHRPLNKCIPRLAARQFISFYEQDESKNDTLLKFAKIDFNRLQLLYQEELYQLTKWYRNLDISANLTYARDRIVEVYFCWAFAVYFEPQFSKARMIVSKAVEVMSIIDDTYDVYGTIEELRIFTDAIQRMNLDVVDELPEYMKCVYQTLLNLFDEWDDELTKEGLSYNTSYTRDSFKELVRAYHVEAEWCNKGYVPGVEEYMSNALTSSCYTAIAMCCFIGMGELAGNEAFEWVKALPKMQVANQEICRLINDTVSHEAEQKRGHVASFIECYMKQYNVSEKEAVEASNKRVDCAWKSLNDDFMNQTSHMSMAVLMRIVNLARSVEVGYRYDDGYTNPEESLKFHIDSLLIQPIPM